jgi:tetratricopeptide (TPR) repeat protein
MVKFSVFGKGLEQDVAEMSDRYLRSEVERKTMLICSLLDISNTEITDNLLDKCGILETAHNLDGSILRRNSDGRWNTKHPRWDLELFSFFFNKKSGTQLEERKQDFEDSIIALYHLREDKIIYSVIGAVYYIAAEKFVPLDVTESVLVRTVTQIPKSTASDLAAAYSAVMRERGMEMLDILAISNLKEGLRYYDVGDYEGAIKRFDIVLEKYPRSAEALYLKKLALHVLDENNAQNKAKP